MPKPAVPLEGQLCFAIYAAGIAINRAYKPLLDELGLTYPQYLVLSTLWEGGPHTVGRIAERLDLEPSTITPLVKRLEQAGLVDRRRNPDDERQVVVAPTRRGADLETRAGCLLEALLERSRLTVPEIADLNARVRALTAAVSRPAADG